MPGAVIEDLENERAVIPTDGPNRIGGGSSVTRETSGAGDLGELIATDHGPFFRGAVPRGEDARGNLRINKCSRAMFAVVSVEQKTLARVKTFAMIAGKIGFAAVFELLVTKKFSDGERVDIDLVKAFFHRGVINFVRWIGQMSGISSGSAVHFFVRNGAHPALRVDGVEADEELLRFAVNETIGRGTTNALRAGGQPKRGVNFIQLIVGALGFVWGVGDNP